MIRTPFVALFAHATESGLFNCINNLLECLGVVHSQVSQNLTIQSDTCLVELTHKLRIGQTVSACSSVDTLDPQAAECSLLDLAVCVSILQTFFNGVFGNRPYVSP